MYPNKTIPLLLAFVLILFSSTGPYTSPALAESPEANAEQPSESPEETLRSIYLQLRNRKYAEAESAAREAIRHFPKIIEFYICLDQALNGQEKFEEAETLRSTILEVWEKNYKEEFLENGSPIRDRTWARMLLYGKGFVIIACEYFIPEQLGEEPAIITNHYKFIVMYGPNPEDGRVFKLEHSNINQDYYVISELTHSGFTQTVPFGSRKPPIHIAARALLQVLLKQAEHNTPKESRQDPQT